MIENKDLRIFIALAETQSFTLAADRLFLTQSAISKRLHHLEHQLGIALIDRQQRPWQLTAAGQRLLPLAKQNLAFIAGIEHNLKVLEAAPLGTLDLAISHHLSLYRLPLIIKAYQKRYPKVRLNLAFLTSDEVHHQVSIKQYELGFATLKSARPNRLDYHPLWDDELIFVGSRHLSWTTAIQTLESLCKRPAVLPQTSSLYFQMVNQLFLAKGCNITEVFPANYLETVRSMVGVGFGWSVLPNAMLDQRLIPLKLLDAYQLNRSLGALARKHKTLSPAAQAFLNLALTADEHRY